MEVWKIIRYFAENKRNKNMAKPIAPTPPLKGQAAVDFVEEINKNKKASMDEKTAIKKGASRIKSMLTFTF